jgi:hypothetical protein
MKITSYRFVVQRDRKSYQFKVDMNSPDSWDGDHNAQNNMIDRGILLNPDGKAVWYGAMQTVANMPGARHSDTIVPGEFLIVWDVDRRAFKGHIHGISGAFDQDGQSINADSVETVPGKDGAPADWARWIFGHSTRKNDPAPDGELTRYAWSAGCFITTPFGQDDLFRAGSAAGFKSGDEISCSLMEV